MARINVTLPDALATIVREQMPGLNVSGVLQEALQSLVECRHDALGCPTCGATVKRAAVADTAVSGFYRELIWALHPPIARCETAEGAARVMRAVARDHGVDVDHVAPLPRATKAQRARAAAELRKQSEREELALYESGAKPRRRARGAA